MAAKGKATPYGEFLKARTRGAAIDQLDEEKDGRKNTFPMKVFPKTGGTRSIFPVRSGTPAKSGPQRSIPENSTKIGKAAEAARVAAIKRRLAKRKAS